jgi:SAM-dependent methyltransferase
MFAGSCWAQCKGEMVLNKCRLCGADSLYPLFKQGDRGQFIFYRCRSCSLVNYDFSEQGLNQEKYAEIYIDPEDETGKINRDQTDSFDHIQKMIPRPGKLLEIGCGNGRLLLLARRAGWEVTGLELSPFLAESITGRLGIKVHTANFLEGELPLKETFDLVVMRHVLEHLPDPILAMNRIGSLLKPGGRAILEFPNIDGWDLRWKRSLQRIGIHRKRYPESYVPGHCNEYCRRSFNWLVGKTGFVLKNWSTYSSRPGLTPLYAALGSGNKVRVLVEKIPDTVTLPDNQV